MYGSHREDLAAARPVTRDTGRGIRFYGWAYTNRHILYIQDKNGDENWRLYSVDLTTDEVKDLTPFEDVQTQLRSVSHKFPEEVIAGLNNRVPQWHDLYRINVVTGEMMLIEQNDSYASFVVDDDYRLRIALRMTPDGGMALFIRGAGDDWQPWDTIPTEDILTTGPAGVDKAGAVVFMKDSRGRNTAAVMACHLATKEATLLAEDPQADAQDVVCHPTEKHVQAVSFVYERKRWQILDPGHRARSGLSAHRRGRGRGDRQPHAR